MQAEQAKIPMIDRVEEFIKKKYQIRANLIKRNNEVFNVSKKTWTKLNSNNIYRQLQAASIKYSKANLDCLLDSDFVSEHNPVEEYFKYIHWDGIDRIDDLADHLITEDKEWTRMQLKKHLVRTVACALDPKFFNKHCFILVHNQQNSGKTSFCNWLCPPRLEDYYSQVMIDPGNKDSWVAMAENFMINLDELATISRREINQLKSIISLQEVNVRRAYRRDSDRAPRIASFVGSTNDMNFLTDNMNVRWICIQIEGINFDYSKKFNIDEIWAEAMHLYKTGFDYRFSKEEIVKNEANNEEFRSHSAEEMALSRHMTPGEKGDLGSEHLNINEIIGYLHKQTGMERITLFPAKMGVALSYQGYKKTKVKGVTGFWCVKNLGDTPLEPKNPYG